MRRFILLGQKASTSPDFPLDDVPGTTGRLDVLIRCLGSALLVSHGLRRDTIVYLVLYGGSVGPRSIRIDGRVASYLRPDERAMAGRIRAMLGTKAEGEGFLAERQGMAVADGGLDVVLRDLGPSTPYVLDEDGADLRSAPLDVESPAFFVGDHLGFDPLLRERLRSLARPIAVGPLSLHADDAIALTQNELDRRAVPSLAPADILPPAPPR